MKLNANQKWLRKIGVAVDAAGALFLHVMRFACKEVPETGTDEEKAKAISTSFETALTGLENATNTLRQYLANAIHIALRQHVVAKISVQKAEGQIGKAPTRDVTVATARTRREVAKLAEAAREARTGKMRTPRLSIAAVPAAAPAGNVAPKIDAITLATCVEMAFDGKHAEMRLTLIDRLKAHGFMLAPYVERAVHAPQPMPVAIVQQKKTKRSEARK
jgi:hypothetical protein